MENMISEDFIEKCLDCFLILEQLLEIPLHFQHWNEVGGDYGHYPILIEIIIVQEEPTSPFKLNPY